MTEYERAFGSSYEKASHFEKLTDGRVAATFADPKGRKDFAGRTIPHQVVIPASMANGINSVDDVVNKVWPTLEQSYVYE